MRPDGRLGLSGARLRRDRRQVAARLPLVAVRPRPRPARALAVTERQGVVDLLREPQYVDLAPAQWWDEPQASIAMTVGASALKKATISLRFSFLRKTTASASFTP